VVDKKHSGGGGGKLWPLIDENLWKEFLLLVADTAENC
jgi:mannose-1-phosphate guanylyltransferase